MKQLFSIANGVCNAPKYCYILLFFILACSISAAYAAYSTSVLFAIFTLPFAFILQTALLKADKGVQKGPLQNHFPKKRSVFGPLLLNIAVAFAVTFSFPYAWFQEDIDKAAKALVLTQAESQVEAKVEQEIKTFVAEKQRLLSTQQELLKTYGKQRADELTALNATIITPAKGKRLTKVETASNRETRLDIAKHKIETKSKSKEFSEAIAAINKEITDKQAKRDALVAAKKAGLADQSLDSLYDSYAITGKNWITTQAMGVLEQDEMKAGAIQNTRTFVFLLWFATLLALWIRNEELDIYYAINKAEVSKIHTNLKRKVSSALTLFFAQRKDLITSRNEDDGRFFTKAELKEKVDAVWDDKVKTPLRVLNGFEMQLARVGLVLPEWSSEDGPNPTKVGKDLLPDQLYDTLEWKDPTPAIQAEADAAQRLANETKTLEKQRETLAKMEESHKVSLQLLAQQEAQLETDSKTALVEAKSARIEQVAADMDRYPELLTEYRNKLHQLANVIIGTKKQSRVQESINGFWADNLQGLEAEKDALIRNLTVAGKTDFLSRYGDAPTVQDVTSIIDSIKVNVSLNTRSLQDQNSPLSQSVGGTTNFEFLSAGSSQGSYGSTSLLDREDSIAPTNASEAADLSPEVVSSLNDTPALQPDTNQLDGVNVSVSADLLNQATVLLPNTNQGDEVQTDQSEPLTPGAGNTGNDDSQSEV